MPSVGLRMASIERDSDIELEPDTQPTREETPRP